MRETRIKATRIKATGTAGHTRQNGDEATCLRGEREAGLPPAVGGSSGCADHWTTAPQPLLEPSAPVGVCREPRSSTPKLVAVTALLGVTVGPEKAQRGPDFEQGFPLWPGVTAEPDFVLDDFVGRQACGKREFLGWPVGTALAGAWTWPLGSDRSDRSDQVGPGRKPGAASQRRRWSQECGARATHTLSRPRPWSVRRASF